MAIDSSVTGPFTWLLLAAFVLAALGLATAVALVRALRARRPLRATNRLLATLALEACAVAAALLALALHGYGRLTSETPVARLSFSQTAPQAFQARLELADGRRLLLPVVGDEWQLDARVVKWRPWAVLAGLDPVYRLDRLSGRFLDIEREQAPGRSVHDLAGGRRLDLWRIAQSHPHWLPFVDTEYGSGAYLPMRDGAAYEVTLSPLGGLVARPLEAPAADDPAG